MRPGIATASPAASEKTSENIISENISELAEDIIHVHAAAAIESAPSIVKLHGQNDHIGPVYQHRLILHKLLLLP